MKWHGNVYLFPPPQSYFWHHKSQRWKTTRGLSPTLTSGQAIWWKAIKRKWLSGEIESGNVRELREFKEKLQSLKN